MKRNLARYNCSKNTTLKVSYSKAAAVQHELKMSVLVGGGAVCVCVVHSELVDVVVVKQECALDSREVISGNGLVLNQLSDAILHRTNQM